jgi:hypothetical protein
MPDSAIPESKRPRGWSHYYKPHIPPISVPSSSVSRQSQSSYPSTSPSTLGALDPRGREIPSSPLSSPDSAVSRARKPRVKSHKPSASPESLKSASTTASTPAPKPEKLDTGTKTVQALEQLTAERTSEETQASSQSHSKPRKWAAHVSVEDDQTYVPEYKVW